MYILRIEFDDTSRSRISVHPDSKSARTVLVDYVQSSFRDGRSEDDRKRPQDEGDIDALVASYFNTSSGESFSIEATPLAGADPFDTIRSLHALIQSFVRERIENIIGDLTRSVVDPGDFETLEYLDEDIEDQVGHVSWFLNEANRIVGSHGMEAREV
jgi:hypothetical protein